MKLRNGVTARTTSVKVVPTLFCVYFVNYFVTIVFSNQTSVMYSGISRENPFMRENLLNCKESSIYGLLAKVHSVNVASSLLNFKEDSAECCL